MGEGRRPERLFEALNDELDISTVMIDGTFVKVHQNGIGSSKESARPGESPSDEAEAGKRQN